jgi:ligand-binding SRPBCC domain-containing protein
VGELPRARADPTLPCVPPLVTGEWSFRIASEVVASPARVWSVISTFDGVNDELAPWLHMTAPRSVSRLTPETVPLGEKLFRSWILAFGVLPIDWDDLVLRRIEPERGFLETSTLLSHSEWRHERILTAITATTEAAGCLIEDRISGRPRVPGTGIFLAAVLRAVFRHRHRRLRRRFGVPAERRSW